MPCAKEMARTVWEQGNQHDCYAVAVLEAIATHSHLEKAGGHVSNVVLLSPHFPVIAMSNCVPQMIIFWVALIYR